MRNVTTPVGIANATAVTGRVMAHQAVATDTRTSQRARGSSRQRSRAHHATIQVAAVVTSEKYEGRNPSGTGANVHKNQASSAVGPFVTRRTVANNKPAVRPLS